MVPPQPGATMTVPRADSVPSGSDATDSRAHNAKPGALSAGSRGVMGLEGLNLTSSSASDTRVSIVSSDKKNVKLESGTQLVLLISEQSKK